MCIRDRSRTISEIFEEDPEKWQLGFEHIYWIFPLRCSRKGRRVVEYKPFIELLNAMLKGVPYPKEQLIRRALIFARIHRYGVYGLYNIREVEEKLRDAELCRGLIKFNMLLTLLRKIGVLNLVESAHTEYGIDQKMEEFMSSQGYDEGQRALFMLGVLVGKIGIEQYHRGDKKKSVLNKIDFEGMSVEKLKRLANYILKGLRDYRILEWNEDLYARMKELLDRNVEKLNNPLDNTFYVLSGYAYITLQAIISKGG